MHLRPATARDLDALLAFPLDPALGGVEPGRLGEELDAGRMRWPWTWLAIDNDGTAVARALWWGRPESTTPLTLDCLHLLDHVSDRADIAADLLRRAHRSFATQDTALAPRSPPSTSSPSPRTGGRTRPPSTRCPGGCRLRPRPV